MSFYTVIRGEVIIVPLVSPGPPVGEPGGSPRPYAPLGA